MLLKKSSTECTEIYYTTKETEDLNLQIMLDSKLLQNTNNMLILSRFQNLSYLY